MSEMEANAMSDWKIISRPNSIYPIIDENRVEITFTLTYETARGIADAHNRGIEALRSRIAELEAQLKRHPVSEPPDSKRDILLVSSTTCLKAVGQYDNGWLVNNNYVMWPAYWYEL